MPVLLAQPNLLHHPAVTRHAVLRFEGRRAPGISLLYKQSTYSRQVSDGIGDHDDKCPCTEQKSMQPIGWCESSNNEETSSLPCLEFQTANRVGLWDEQIDGAGGGWEVIDD